MHGFDLLLLLTAFDRPALLPALLIITAIAARRFAQTTGRALTMAAAFVIALQFAAWLAYGSARPVHAACALVGVAVFVPIAVRSRRTYPLIVAGANLLSALAQLGASLLAGPQADAASAIAALANVAMAIALWTGLANDRRWRAERRRAAVPAGQST